MFPHQAAFSTRRPLQRSLFLTRTTKLLNVLLGKRWSIPPKSPGGRSLPQLGPAMRENNKHDAAKAEVCFYACQHLIGGPKSKHVSKRCLCAFACCRHRGQTVDFLFGWHRFLTTCAVVVVQSLHCKKRVNVHSSFRSSYVRNLDCRRRKAKKFWQRGCCCCCCCVSVTAIAVTKLLIMMSEACGS